MIAALRAPGAMFGTETLRAGWETVRAAFAWWLVVKAGETLFASALPALLPYADALAAVALVAAYALARLPSGALGRSALAWLAAVPAAAVTAVVVVSAAQRHLAGDAAGTMPGWAVAAAAESFAGGSLLGLVLCGPRSGALACAVNAGGAAFGVLIGLAAYLGAVASSGSIAQPPELAAVAAGEAAMWPITIVVAGAAFRDRGAVRATRWTLAAAVLGAAAVTAFAVYPRLAQRSAATPPRAPAVATKAGVVRAFYDDVTAERYERAYDLLSPDFQRAETLASFAARYGAAQRMEVRKIEELPGTSSVAACIVVTWRRDPASTTYGGTITLAHDAASNGWRIDRRDLGRLSGPSLLPPVTTARAAPPETASPPPFDPGFCGT